MTRTARMVDPGTIWVQACETVRVRVGERNFAAWIAPLRCTWAEGEIALRSLLVDRFPGLTLAGPAPTWRSAFTLRGVESLWASTGA